MSESPSRGPQGAVLHVTVGDLGEASELHKRVTPVREEHSSAADIDGTGPSALTGPLSEEGKKD